MDGKENTRYEESPRRKNTGMYQKLLYAALAKKNFDQKAKQDLYLEYCHQPSRE